MPYDVSFGKIDWKEIKKHRQEKKEKNRQYSTAWLTEKKIPFKSLNGGYMLRIVNKDIYDFWPNTGLFLNRRTKERGRGLRNLYKDIKGK